MRTKRILALILVTVMLVASLASCSSAYNKPAEYLTLPSSLGNIVISYAELKEALDEQLKESLEGSEGQVFEPVTDADAVIQKGDQVYIDYTGTTSADVSESIKEGLSGEDLYLTIGSNSSTFPVDYTNKNNDSSEDDSDDLTTLVEGIEDQLIGHKVGETVTVTGKFSNTYSTSDLKNVEVTYEITIKAIARITVTNSFTVGLTYTVTDDLTEVDADTLLDVIETTSVVDEEETPDSSSETSEDEASPASDDTAADDTDADDTAEDTTDETTEKSFETLFPDVTTSKTFDLTSSTTTFGAIFTVADIVRYLEGKHLYDQFTIQIPVPEDYENEDYASYRGKTIYYTVKIESTTSIPEWTDYFANKWTQGEYETTEAYEEYLIGELKKSLAYDAIHDASEIIEYPYKEWEQSYENYVEQYLCDFLADASDSSSSVTLADFTPSEIKALVSDDEYDAIRVDATNAAKVAVKQRLVMEALFAELGIEITKAEYKEKLAEEEESFNTNFFYYYYYYGIYSFDQYVTYMGGKEYFELQFKYEKLLDKLPEVVQYESAPTEDAE